jgi:hypothetical protein
MRILIITLLTFLISLSVSASDIQSARFSLPTERYDHCVLGDCVEYGAIEAIMDDGRVLSFRLNENSVFEDVEPRLIPMGLNGRNAILTVRAYKDTGAALALLEVRGGELKIVAESEAIGTAHRWQNPIGMGDFDRDGKAEIATVITPHIGGTLTLYERRGNKLVKDLTAYPFSNHKIGSKQLDMHEIIDWDGDKTPDILLPDVTHRMLKVVSFKTGEGKVIAEKEFPFLVTGGVKPAGNGVEFTLSDGNKETWHP